LFDSSAREWRLSPVYEEIMGVESDGNRRVKRGKWGLFDSTNDVWYLEIIYDGVGVIEGDGKRIITNGSGDGLVDTSGLYAVWMWPTRKVAYDVIGAYEGDGKRIVTSGVYQGLLDASGTYAEWPLDIKYKEVDEYEQGDGKRVVTNFSDKQGLIDAVNVPVDWVLKIVYDEVGEFETADNHRRIKFDAPVNRYTLINAAGTWPPVDLSTYFTRIDDADARGVRIAELYGNLGTITNGVWEAD
jgi:hypothetical protein